MVKNMNLKMFSAKKVFMLTAVLAAFAVCPLRGSSQVVVVDSVVDCITRTISDGNADSLTSFFNKRVELLLPDYSVVSSRNQARVILRQFFAQNKPTMFTVLAQNVGNDGISVIGTLSSGEQSYRISFLTKQQMSQQLVYQFSIE